MRGRLKALEREHRGRAWLAWHSALIGKMQRPPGLSDLMGIKPVVQKMSPAEVKSAFAAMREAAKA